MRYPNLYFIVADILSLRKRSVKKTVDRAKFCGGCLEFHLNSGQSVLQKFFFLNYRKIIFKKAVKEEWM